ncbi:MAG: hypothetical protein Q7K16_03555 [Candidatus Azambacteria bacterium]|nr:hypothetical protein [Candidatus Azambacteria bacterium]
MKSAFIILLIVGFLGVAVFGFLSMIYSEMHDGGCIASNSLSALCPLNDVFIFVVYHLGAFKYFSTAVFAVTLLSLLFGAIFSILPRPLDKDEEDDYVFSIQIGKFPKFIKSKEVARWLSLHINSPALILAAV